MTRDEVKALQEENKKLKAASKNLKNLEKEAAELKELKAKLAKLEEEKEELEEKVRSKHELKENLGIEDIIELPEQSYSEITRLNNVIGEAQNTINNILSTIIAVYKIDTENYNLEFTPDNKALIIREKE